MPYDDYTTPIVGATPPPDPQQPATLPALLTALGGLGLNIAGAFTRSGAHGDQSLSLSRQLQAQTNEEAQQKYRRNAVYEKKKGETEIAKTFMARLGEVRNPDARNVIKTSLEKGEVDRGQSLLYHELGLQNADDRERKSDRRIQNQDDSQMARALGDYITQRTGMAKETSKQLPPEVLQARANEQFFASQTKHFEDPQELKAAYNARADVKKKIGDKEAASLFNTYTNTVNQARRPALGNEFLGKTLGFGQAPLPSEIFKGWAEKVVSPEALKAAQEKEQELAAHKEGVATAHDLRQRLMNPQTRDGARRDIETFFSGASPAPTISASDWEKLSPAGREHALKQGFQAPKQQKAKKN